MITPETVEEHLKESKVRCNLKRYIENELAKELDSQGFLDQILKHRIYNEVARVARQEIENNDRTKKECDALMGFKLGN